MLISAEVRREGFAPRENRRIASVPRPRSRIVVGDRMIFLQVHSDSGDRFFRIVIVLSGPFRLGVQTAKNSLGHGEFHPRPAAPVGGPILQKIQLPLAEQLRRWSVALRRRIPGWVERKSVDNVRAGQLLLRRRFPFSVFQDREAYSAP